jgi:hypothetical protein
MSAVSPVAYEPRDTDAPPPQELTWDSTIKDLFAVSYNLSDDLLTGAPRMIRMYADRWQVNWQLSGIEEPQDQTVIDIFITVRPVAPATITIKV